MDSNSKVRRIERNEPMVCALSEIKVQLAQVWDKNVLINDTCDGMRKCLLPHG